ncbi:MAG: RNA-binding cell elongation regulator Jag/EloR [Syntrophobacteraceae bacterium]
MSTLEFEEKSVEEAIELACRQLKLPREKLEIEIVSKGSSGIFGIVGARRAKIRVTTKIAPAGLAAEKSKEVLDAILEHIDLPMVVEAETREGYSYLNIISNGSGLLIGKRGKTLNALQFLVSKIVSRQTGESVSLLVDTENYRAKREESLSDLARQLSEKVKKTHRSLTTGPMSAQDRRVVHLALKDDHDVRTKSKGEGSLRRVIIYPVRKPKEAAKAEEQAE